MSLHQLQYSLTQSNFKIGVGENYSFHQHFHSNYELIYCLSGICTITINGIDEVLNQGELVLISPYTLHSTNMENSRVAVASFSKDYIFSFDQNNRSFQYSKFHLSREVEDFAIPQLLQNSELSTFMRMSCLYMICDECIKNAHTTTKISDYKFVSHIVDYLSTHIQEDLTLKALTEVLGYEYHYFSALFHKHFNMNFKQFVNYLRFDTACILLSQRTDDISDISYMCGFGSIRNFNRVFKQFANCSPKEYRQREAAYLQSKKMCNLSD